MITFPLTEALSITSYVLNFYLFLLPHAHAILKEGMVLPRPNTLT